MSSQVFALYPDGVKAEEAVDGLTSAGCLSDDISILMRTSAGAKGAGGTLGLLADFASFPVTGDLPMVAAGRIQSEQNRTLGRPQLEQILQSLGLAGSDVDRYAMGIRDGHIFLSVRCELLDDIGKISSVLQSSGAEAIARGQDPPREREH